MIPFIRVLGVGEYDVSLHQYPAAQIPPAGRIFALMGRRYQAGKLDPRTRCFTCKAL